MQSPFVRVLLLPHTFSFVLRPLRWRWAMRASRWRTLSPWMERTLFAGLAQGPSGGWVVVQDTNDTFHFSSQVFFNCNNIPKLGLALKFVSHRTRTNAKFSLQHQIILRFPLSTDLVLLLILYQVLLNSCATLLLLRLLLLPLLLLLLYYYL